MFSPSRLRNYRDFFAYDARWGHAHWLYQHNGGVFLPPWGKCEQWTLSVQHTADDVELAARTSSASPATCVADVSSSIDGRRLDPRQCSARVGLPAPISELAATRPGTSIVVGGGHNGLACAAYLAKAGKSVLVLERREQLGGACTLDDRSPTPATRSARARTSSACSTSG